MATNEPKTPEEIMGKFQITVRECSVLIGISASRIYNLISEGKFPFPYRKIAGGTIRFQPAEVLRYLERVTVSPPKAA
jgi:excisionase family DNA binding protein